MISMLRNQVLGHQADVPGSHAWIGVAHESLQCNQVHTIPERMPCECAPKDMGGYQEPDTG